MNGKMAVGTCLIKKNAGHDNNYGDACKLKRLTDCLSNIFRL